MGEFVGRRRHWMSTILLFHSDPNTANLIRDELSDLSVVSVESVYSILNMVSDPRYELLIAERSLIKPWLECIEGQRPAMPIIIIGDELEADEWSYRTLRNAVIGLSERWVLDCLASTRPALRSFY
jgi:hypothetical protein